MTSRPAIGGSLRLAAAVALSLAALGPALASLHARDQGATSIQPQAPQQVLFNRFHVPASAIHIADANGANERPLVPGLGLTYSPMFSTGGDWVVFTAERDGQADVFRVRPDGSGLEQLTDSPAFDDQGTLSPDGRTLAFVSTRGNGHANVWTLDLVTRATKSVTNEPAASLRPAWSPDGSWLAFSSDRGPDAGVNPGRWEHLQSLGVYVIRPDGTALRRLTREGGVAGSPSWSQDGRRILCYETDEVGAFMAKSGNARTEIVEIDVASGRRRVVTASNETKLSPQALSNGRVGFVTRAASPTGGLRVWRPDLLVDTVIPGAIRNPSWSSDGTKVVFQRLARLGSTQHLEPTFSRDPAFALVLTEPFPAFSPNGKQLLYSQYGAGRNARIGLDTSSTSDTSIQIMAANGADKRALFRRDGFSAFSATWSPAGDDIALSVGRYFRAAGLPPAQIALIKPDGTGFRLLVDDDMNNGFPSWSPDGSRLVFKRGGALAIIRVATKEITPLTDGRYSDNFPQWSPASATILFTSDRGDGFALYTIQADGTGLRRLTHGRGSDAHASWCGEWVVFTSSRMGFKDEMALYDGVPQPYGEIFAMRSDGSDVRQLTDNKWEDASATCAVSLRP